MLNLKILKRKNQYCQVITILAFCFVLFGCATGSHIITGKVRPAIDPIGVKLYVTPPTKYETIAIVEASSDVEFSSQNAQNRAVEQLKKQAGKLGANGVLLTGTDSKSSGGVLMNGIYVTSDKKVVRGEAIYVTEE